MKIKYADMYIINMALNNCLAIHTLDVYFYKNFKFFKLQRFLSKTRFNISDNIFCLYKTSMYKLFRHSIFLALWRLAICNVASKKSHMYYIANFISNFSYLQSLVKLFFGFLLFGESALIITSTLVKFLEINVSFDTALRGDMLNFLLNNDVSYVLCVNKLVSPLLFKKLYEFDINLIDVCLFNDNFFLSGILLNLLYVAKEYYFFQKLFVY